MAPFFFPDPLPSSFNINSTVGAFEIGTLVATALFGATSIQTYIYFERYATDHKLVKALVTAIWLLEIGHTVCICHALYTMTVTWYAQPELLAVPPTSLDISILLNSFIGPLEQAWFTRRLYVLSKNKWLTSLCCLLSFARMAAGVGYAALALQRLNLIVFELRYWWILIFIVVLGSINDLLLACSLAWYLNKVKKDNYQRISKLLNRLIMWAVETSAMTSFATLSMMICAFTMPTNFIFIAIYVTLSKLYSNALLASLNAREAFKQQFGQEFSTESVSDERSRLQSRFTQPGNSALALGSQFSSIRPPSMTSIYTEDIPLGDVTGKYPSSVKYVQS